jgi:SNF2 family DNA or RNA helicase
MTTHYEDLKAALLNLDARCDGARDLDGQGFNGTDSKFGKYLASILLDGRNLSPGQQSVAIKMLQKYQITQLVHILLPKPEDYVPFGTSPATGKSRPSSSTAQRSPAVTKETVQASPPEFHRVFSRDAIIIIALNHNAPNFDATLLKIQSLKERHWEGQSKEWHVPRRLAPEVVEIFKTEQVSMYHLIDTWAKEIEATRAKIRETALAQAKQQSLYDFLAQQSKAIRPTRRQELVGFGVTLRMHQEVPLEIFRTAGRAFVLTDDMGVGKTFESLSIAYDAIKASDERGEVNRPVFIVTPPATIYNWKAEIQKALPYKNLSPVMLLGTLPYGVPTEWARVFVVPDSVLTNWAQDIIDSRPLMIIYDEAHRFKDRKAERTKAFLRVAASADINLPMTGTPIENSPEDFWTLLSAVDPGEWGDFEAYKRLYCEGKHQLDELARRSRYYVVRRNMSDCGEGLPPKTRISVSVPMSAKGLKEYQRRMDAFFEAMRLKEERGESTAGGHLQMIEALKQAAFEGKKDAVLEWIDTFLEANPGKLAISGLHLDAIAYIEQHLKKNKIKLVRITGDESSSVKQDNINSFQRDPSVRVVLLTIKAGGMSHTLTAANTMVTTELWWTPTSHDQVEGRLYRTTQTEKTFFYYLLAAETIDLTIFKIMDRKLNMINAVHGESRDGFEAEESIMSEVLDELWAEHKARKK